MGSAFFGDEFMMGSPRAVRLILLGSVCLMFCLPGCKRQHAAKDTPDDNELETGSGLDSDTVQETDTGSTAVDTSNMDTSSTAVDTLDDETDSESAVDCSAIDEICNDGGCDMTCTDGSYCRCDTEACTIACTSGARCESYSYASSVGSCLGEGTYCCGSGGFSDEKADFQIYCPEE